MAAKRPSLAESMKTVQAAEAVKPARGGQSAVTQRPYFAATREGMKRITVAVSPEDHKKLKVKAAETGRSIEDLMREAVAAVLAKKN